jgi:hypothetical protein
LKSNGLLRSIRAELGWDGSVGSEPPFIPFCPLSNSSVPANLWLCSNFPSRALHPHPSVEVFYWLSQIRSLKLNQPLSQLRSAEGSPIRLSWFDFQSH